MDKCEAFFKALADKNRQKILELLKEEAKEMCVSEICKHFAMTQPAISNHLSILKQANLVSARKQGKEVYYSLNKYWMIDCCQSFFSKFGIITAEETR